MQDSRGHPNGTELGVFFIFQNGHIMAASHLRCFCRTGPQGGSRKLGFCLILVCEEGSCSDYPAKPLALPHPVMKQSGTSWMWGHPEDKVPAPPGPPSTIRGKFKTSFVKCCPWMWTFYLRAAVAEASFCSKTRLQLSLPFGPSGLPSLGGDFQGSGMGFPVLFVGKKKKSPLGMMLFAAAWPVGSLGSWRVGKR
ncbi:unnamed protein product [Rangifer tarandus platyrhynchus]|uniref:Uncharacterized protein n=1 Tax=Rangifer tarandus platyrhynchus TaxID=3082113 RepID=A0AC59YAF0_RANTA